MPVAPMTLPWRAICPTAPWTRPSAAMARCSLTSGVAVMMLAYALAIQPRDGRLVVAGGSNASGNDDFALARYHAITCNGVVATRVGTAGNDTLMGTAGPDVIVGFDGDDTIYGLGGNDLLCGNAGNDTLVGGTGDDTLVGDTGTDVCDGGSHVSGIPPRAVSMSRACRNAAVGTQAAACGARRGRERWPSTPPRKRGARGMIFWGAAEHVAPPQASLAAHRACEERHGSSRDTNTRAADAAGRSIMQWTGGKTTIWTLGDPWMQRRRAMHTQRVVSLIMAVLFLVSTSAFALTCPPTIVKGKSLVIRFPTVVDDPVRTVWTGATTTTSDGAWSFGRLMFNMAGSQHPPTFVRRWLEHWEADRVVNSFTVPARPSIRSLVIDPWPRHPSGNLNLSQAPMRLLAIVYRPDLRDLAQGKAGEGRFVFGVLDSADSSLSFTVILEYILPAKTATEVKDWAVAFQKLSTLSHGPTFNAELEKITNRFAGKNVAPTRINGSAISQVRTNEIALDFPWELREFRLNASDKLLRETTVKQTPDLDFNNTATLARWVDTNAAAILGLTGIRKHRCAAEFRGSTVSSGCQCE